MPALFSRSDVDIEQSAHPMNDTTKFLDRGLYTLRVAGLQHSFPFNKPFSSVRIALTGHSIANLSDQVG